LGRNKEKKLGGGDRVKKRGGRRLGRESRTFSPQCFLVFALARPLFSPSTESLEQVNKLLTCGLRFLGNWENGRFEGEGHFIAPNYTYTGNFTGEQPIGPGRFHFDMGCKQVGEYVTMRKVRRTNTTREVVHVPVWRCLALHEEAPRVMKPKKLPS